MFNIEDLKKTTLNPNDVLVLTIPETSPLESLNLEYITEVFHQNKVIVLHSGITLDIKTKAKRKE